MLTAIGLLAALCCSRAPEPAESRRQLLVVGIDGFDPEALLRLVREGALPRFRAVIERGLLLPMDTAYTASPVIWTTMVTGVRPEQHGVTDFHVETAEGRIPISSAARRRPALWNMLDRTGRRSAILGLWATWPAEPTRGLIVSDRIGLGLDAEISPAGRRSELDAWLAEAKSGGIAFPGSGRLVTNDRVATLAARQALRENDFDLVFVYLRSVDVTSHAFWHLFEPERFPGGPPPGAPIAASPDPVADAYRAADTALAELLAELPTEASLLVVSDHGFEAHASDSPQLLLDFDRVLESLGVLVRGDDGVVDRGSSSAWTERSPSYDWVKRLRVSPALAPARRAELIDDLGRRLARCEFDSSAPAFAPEQVPPAERSQGVDLRFRVLGANASKRLTCEGVEAKGAVVHFARVTGDHGWQTRGLLIAAGPLFRRGRVDARVSIFDVAPTVLYALGLPVGQDFAGEPALAIFDPEFVRAHPVRSIASWGERGAGPTVATSADEVLMEELGALGYLQ